MSSTFTFDYDAVTYVHIGVPHTCTEEDHLMCRAWSRCAQGGDEIYVNWAFVGVGDIGKTIGTAGKGLWKIVKWKGDSMSSLLN